MPPGTWPPEAQAEFIRCNGTDGDGSRCDQSCTTRNTTTPVVTNNDESPPIEVLISTRLPAGWAVTRDIVEDPYTAAHLAVSEYWCPEHAP